MSGTQCAEVIQVIRTKENIGDGTEKDPVRIVIRYWDFEGNLLQTGYYLRIRAVAFSTSRSLSMKYAIDRIKDFI